MREQKKIIDPSGRSDVACPLMGIPTNTGLVFGPCIKTKCEWYQWEQEECTLSTLGHALSLWIGKNEVKSPSLKA